MNRIPVYKASVYWIILPQRQVQQGCQQPDETRFSYMKIAQIRNIVAIVQFLQEGREERRCFRTSVQHPPDMPRETCLSLTWNHLWKHTGVTWNLDMRTQDWNDSSQTIRKALFYITQLDNFSSLHCIWMQATVVLPALLAVSAKLRLLW